MTASDPFKGLDREAGEEILAVFAADKRAYWRSHLIMAAVGGVVAGLVLLIMGDASPWVGPVAAIAALVLRGWYLQSETLGLRWTLTNRRLIIPGPRAFRLPSITTVRPFLGDVQVITAEGDKHLIRYPADSAAVVAAIQGAQK